MNENTILADGELYVNRSADPHYDFLYVGDGVTAVKDLKPIGQKLNVLSRVGELGVPTVDGNGEFKTGRVRAGRVEYGYIFTTDITIPATNFVTTSVVIPLEILSVADLDTLRVEDTQFVATGGTGASAWEARGNGVSSKREGTFGASGEIIDNASSSDSFLNVYVIDYYSLDRVTVWRVWTYITYTKLGESPVVVTPTVPVGTLWPFLLTEPPVGWLVCDGSTLNVADYPDLATCAGMTDNGDGTFTLLDLRGEFLRGADGTTRVPGSKQDDALQNIVGTVGATLGGPTGSYDAAGNLVSGVFVGSNTPTASRPSAASGPGRTITSVSALFDASRVAKTDPNETRPTNTAVLYCVKYDNT